MPGTALWVDGFICHPLSPFICTCLPLSPFICLPLSPSLDAWHGSLGGQFHLSPFVSLHLAPVVSQPGCLSRLSTRTDSLVSLGSPSFVSHLWVDGLICLPLSPFICLPLSPSLDASLGGRIHLSPFVSLCLSPVVSQPGCLARLSGWTDSFVSRCLPAWMCGTHAPRFPSLPAVLSFWRGLVCVRLRPWLRSFLVLLSALHLDFDFAWARGGSSSLSIVGYTLSVRSVPRYQLRPFSVLARMWSPELTRAVRCGARLQLREGSVNPPVKQT